MARAAKKAADGDLGLEAGGAALLAESNHLIATIRPRLAGVLIHG